MRRACANGAILHSSVFFNYSAIFNFVYSGAPDFTDTYFAYASIRKSAAYLSVLDDAMCCHAQVCQTMIYPPPALTTTIVLAMAQQVITLLTPELNSV